MIKLALGFSVLAVMLQPQDASAFGSKRMNVSEVKGVTEAQVARSPLGDKASILVRGKAAELLFLMMKEKKEQQVASDALEMAGSAHSSHWTVKGKQITCSKISNDKKKTHEFACAFEIDGKGEVVAGVEPFNPMLFNLGRSSLKTAFSKKKGRGLASASSVDYSKSSAYVMYDDPASKRKAEDAMVVFRGQAAKGIMSFLSGQEDAKPFTMGGASGIKGKEISCVGANKGESERCALVVALNDGSIETGTKPLMP